MMKVVSPSHKQPVSVVKKPAFDPNLSGEFPKINEIIRKITDENLTLTHRKMHRSKNSLSMVDLEKYHVS